MRWEKRVGRDFPQSKWQELIGRGQDEGSVSFSHIG